MSAVCKRIRCRHRMYQSIHTKSLESIAPPPDVEGGAALCIQVVQLKGRGRRESRVTVHASSNLFDASVMLTFAYLTSMPVMSEETPPHGEKLIDLYE